MKNKKIIGIYLLFISISLSSCGLFDFNAKTVNFIDKKIALYHLNDKDNKREKIKDVTLKFVPEKELIPYVTLADYASMFDYNGGYNYQTAHSVFSGDIWVVYNEANNQSVFALQLDYNNKTVSIAGNLSNALNTGVAEELNNSTITDNLYIETEIIKGDSALNTYSFDNFNIDIYRNGSVYYLPISFLDLNVGNQSDTYFFFNNKDLYRYYDYYSLSNINYQLDNKSYTVVSEYQESLSSEEMPQYLIDYNKECFMYVMENMYGLKDTRKLSSMKDYYVQEELYDDLSSSDSNKRGLAYCNAINKLEDDHSGLLASDLSSVYGETLSRERGTTSIQRSNTRKELMQARKAVYLEKELDVSNGIIYSNDGKTASFVFDSFIYDSKENVKNGIYQNDSFAYFIHQFELLKENNVENVVIDMSTNGGGALYVMFKLLALISKDNLFNCNIKNPNANIDILYYGGVDINNDNIYNHLDCYGDDFNIYLLTSECSFSCGNAFPIIAKKMNNVKLIGKRTGGGECAVEKHILPNLQYIQNSSNLHLGYENYVFEEGIEPDISLEYEEFYDIEIISNKINQ